MKKIAKKNATIENCITRYKTNVHIMPKPKTIVMKATQVAASDAMRIMLVIMPLLGSISTIVGGKLDLHGNVSCTSICALGYPTILAVFAAKSEIDLDGSSVCCIELLRIDCALS